MQKGQLIEASGAFFVRYYHGGKRIAHKLCTKSDLYYSLQAKSVKLLRDEHMLKVNSGHVEDPTRLSVPEFWKQHYLPYAEANLKPSSVHGYKKLWEGVLSDHFKGKFLSSYKTHHASAFLTSLTERFTRSSLAHVRSLCSGIFSLAVNKGLIERNVWREVKVLAKQRDSKPTGHYTLAEVQEALELLASDARAQVAFGLSFFLALRPGELSGLKFEDFSESSVLISRSAWRGRVGTTKTDSAVEVPLIEPARRLVEAWRQASGNPTEGWLFPNPSGARPLDMSAYANRAIRAILKEKYKGLYAARRGMATALVGLTGNAVSAQGMLRHANMATTLAFYKKDTPLETLSGMKLLEAAVDKKED
jgi:integrase